ncbi:hypothetical protein [Streptomyces sp. NPDC059515]|uniref:hypothetical protein n=1 Tax=Streptomyces sp. NPDC059515 TaxID=3346854 RepID=UPI003689D6E2
MSSHRAAAEGSIRAARDTLAEIQGQRTTTDITIANAARAHAIATAAAAQAILALADALADVLATPARAQAYRDAAAQLDQRASTLDALSSSDYDAEACAVRELADAANALRCRAAEIHPAPEEPTP